MSTKKLIFGKDLAGIARIFIGMFAFAIGVNMFIVPINLYNGGFMGMAQIIRTVLTEILHIDFETLDIAGIIYFMFNIPLFALAYFGMGKGSFFANVFGVSMLSAILTIVPVPMVAIIEEPLTACVIGGVLAGWGTGTYLREGISCGGQDILGIYMTRKFKNFSVGKMNTIINVAVFIVCVFLFNLTTVIYSVIYALVTSMAIDKFHLQNICIEATIFTKSGAQEIKEYIMNDLGRGCNIWNGEGGYTAETTTVIYTVIDKDQMPQLKQFVHSVDDKAFVVCKEDISVEGNFIKKV